MRDSENVEAEMCRRKTRIEFESEKSKRKNKSRRRRVPNRGTVI